MIVSGTNMISDTSFVTNIEEKNTEKEDYVETGYFSNYTTEKECQEAIDFFNSFKIVKVS